MLVRAARCKARPFILKGIAPAEPLYLPWLCPALLDYQASRHHSITADSRPHVKNPRKRRNSTDNPSSSRRSLATAVDYRPFDDIPFEGLEPRQNVRHGSLATLKPWDPTHTLRLSDSLATPPTRHRISQAIGGEVHEILSVLEACLQVGRVERAAVIIKRLQSIGELDKDQMLHVHNRYLSVALDKVLGYPNEAATQALHKWFELEIKGKELPVTNATLVYMLKASMQSSPGSRRDRLVRRYMSMVDEKSVLEILHSELLTAEEINHIVHITQTIGHTTADDVEESSHVVEVVTKKETSEPKSPMSKHVVPDVRPVEQKGLGLKALKQSLSIFANKAEDFNPDLLSREEQRARQYQVEVDAVQSAIDRWREESTQLAKLGVDTVLQTKSLGSRMWTWHGALSEHLKIELTKIEASEAKEKRSVLDQERCVYGPFLRYLPVDKLAAVTILATMRSISAYGVDKGVALSGLILSVAKAVEDESITESVLKSKLGSKSRNQEELGKLARQAKGRRTGPQFAESLSRLVAGPDGRSEGNPRDWDPQWPASIRVKVGSFLLESVIKAAKVPVVRRDPETQELITQMQPAFSHAYQYKLGKKTGVITANNVLVSQLKREPVHSLLAKHLPMIAEPEPWTAFGKGGFLLHPAKAMRIKLGDKDQRHYAEAAIGKGDMDQMFKGLDVLGKTSWRINQPVFDAMLDAWNSGEDIAGLPPAEPNLEVPPEPEVSSNPADRRRWLRQVKAVENERAGLHSQRCFLNFQMEIARALRDETFYFPHNVDFRGRAYPIPPYFNHMGADNARGLLMFGQGKELGERGLKWLKIHLANVFGFDKASLTDREAFAGHNIADVYDSAQNPLSGSRWWTKAEDPWQCLAACVEVRNALESPDPAKFVSYLPIHQDGTCNGLQHYAALGGDEWGAKQVNLEPGDRPADVYSAVADLVKKSITEDKAQGNQMAVYLDGKITRKVVKQTVMTNVYGVTFIGAQAQVKKQLLASYNDLPATPEMNAGYLASYVARKIFIALSSMFRGAHDIQYWLGECASRIATSITAEQLDAVQHALDLPQPSSRARPAKISTADEHLQFKSSVIWTNPLRMPVVQPYRANKSRIIYTNLQRISISDPHRSDPVSKRKQLQGFPPNFVHSLDATHMILSALRCHELGLSFASVHDSFWTHASDIEVMNDVLRDAFIRVHEEDVIGRLALEFQARYKGGVYLAKVQSDTKFGKSLMKWRKSVRTRSATNERARLTFKGIKMDELMNERLRLRLLASSNPKDVEKGKQIVTPGSIFEEQGAEAEHSLLKSDDISAIGLGELPSPDETESRAAAVISNESAEIDILDIDGNAVAMPEAADEEATSEGMEPNALSATEEPRLDSFTKALQKPVRKAKSASSKPTELWAWLPMNFPPVPEKGTFDVSRLKNSQYFFS